MSKTIIKLLNISKSYNGREILKDANLSIEEGSKNAIIGESGSGKSTCLNILAFFETYDSGEYYLNNQLINNVRRRDTFFSKLRNENFGFVFQSFNLIPGLTVEENILLPLQYATQETKGNSFDINSLASFLKISHLLENDVINLSGGEKQRVAIARALINKPSVIFADEPTGNLDRKTKDEVLNLLESVNEEFNIALVIVTHELDVAIRMDRKFSIVNKKFHETKLIRN